MQKLAHALDGLEIPLLYHGLTAYVFIGGLSSMLQRPSWWATGVYVLALFTISILCAIFLFIMFFLLCPEEFKGQQKKPV